MLYNGVLVSALKQSESAMHIHISPYLFPLASPSLPPFELDFELVYKVSFIVSTLQSCYKN